MGAVRCSLLFCYFFTFFLELLLCCTIPARGFCSSPWTSAYSVGYTQVTISWVHNCSPLFSAARALGRPFLLPSVIFLPSAWTIERASAVKEKRRAERRRIRQPLLHDRQLRSRKRRGRNRKVHTKRKCLEFLR